MSDTQMTEIRPPASWSVLLAWLVIIAVVVFVGVMVDLRYQEQAAINTTQPTHAVDMQKAMQFRILAQQTFAMPVSAANTSATQTELDKIAKGSVILQIRAAILAGEWQGKDVALERLKNLNTHDDQEIEKDVATLQNLYVATTNIPASELSKLVDHHGWYAYLAQTYGKTAADPTRQQKVIAPAKQKSLIVMGMGLVFLLTCLLSIVLAVTGIVLYATGYLKMSLPPTIAPAGWYAHSAAIYLGGFVVMSLVITKYVSKDIGMLGQVIPMIGIILIAIAWPIMRGVPFGVWRKDVGLTTGKHILLEPLFGITGYIAGLPITVSGFIIATFLLKDSGVSPTHPIMKSLADPNEPVFGLFLLACVFAPITEEIMFRGTLFQAMRPKIQWFISALFTSIIFAAIHPQGWRMVPVLGAIGLVLNLIRQWRGSLIASMTAHALNNFTMLIIALLLYR